jgi:hypothetical protein
MSIAVPSSPTGVQLSYRNSKGKKIAISVSQHARHRFWLRWNHLYPNSPLDFSEVDTRLSEWFARADRLFNLSKELQNRQKRHGKDTLYFKTNGFTFVVQDATLLTVEISDRGKRHLNKKSPPPSGYASSDQPRQLPKALESSTQCDQSHFKSSPTFSVRAWA